MRSSPLIALLILAAMKAMLIPSMAQVPPTPVYTVTDLGNAALPTTYGCGVNDAGMVAGYFIAGYPQPGPLPLVTSGKRRATDVPQTSSLTDQSCLFNSDGIQAAPLSLLGMNCRAHSINNFDNSLVGESQIEGNAATHAFLYSAQYGNISVDLGTLGGTNSAALDINNGYIVGWADLAGDTATHAFVSYGHGLFDGGHVYDLGTLGGTSSYAESVSLSGRVAGYSQTVGDAATHAVLYGSPSQDLGTLGGTNSYAYGVSGDVNNSLVVGTSQITGDVATHAFTYDSNAGMTDLDVLPGGTNSYAKAVSKYNVVVGYSGVRAGTHAFVYQASSLFVEGDQTLHDLNDLIPSGTGWELQHAEAISTSGLITGYGSYFGQTHAFLLQPFFDYNRWAAAAIAAAPDGGTDLLWCRQDGAASIWTIDAIYSATYGPVYGPFPGWKAQGIAVDTPAVGSIGPAVASFPSAHLLWTNPDGRASVWNIDGRGHATYGPIYGPYAGWTAKKITSSFDGTTLLLWTKSDGSTSYWQIAPDDSDIIYSPVFGPFAGWTAVGIAGGPDGAVRLAWNNVDGSTSYWTVGPDNMPEYGPVEVNYRFAKGIGVGTDGNTCLLYTNQQHADGLFAVNLNDTVSSSRRYFGPYEGWTAQAMSESADNVTRLLWTNVYGSASFWLVGPDNVPHYSPIYGPY